jgi:tetratricopeptide (TPR) repeat protein
MRSRAIASLILIAPVAIMAAVFGTQRFPASNSDSTVSYLMKQAKDHISRGEFDQAAAEYSRALSLSSSQATIIVLLADRGTTYHYMHKFNSALADYDRAIVFIFQHKDQQARADLDKALKLPRKNADVWNGIAWLRAMCPNGSFRDGKEAIRAAREACDLTNWKDTNIIDTLAAAYAEAGDFDRAITYQEQALRPFSGDVLKKAQEQLALYRRHKPYREELAKAVMSNDAGAAAQQTSHEN